MKTDDRKPTETTRLMINVTASQQVQLMHLVEIGYGDGSTPASVVEYALARFLDDVRRNGIYYVNRN